MTTEIANYCVAAIANYAAKNKEDEIAVTQKRYCTDLCDLEVTSKAMSEDDYISSSLLKAMETIAEAWGGWAHVEYDREERQLLIILS